MGQYTIVIIGEGAHHSGSEDDADKMAQRLVDELRARGQTVHHAIITHGTHEHLKDEKD